MQSADVSLSIRATVSVPEREEKDGILLTTLSRDVKLIEIRGAHARKSVPFNLSLRAADFAVPRMSGNSA